ncbi:MAG: ribonuclease T [Croceibacterium sp.]
MRRLLTAVLLALPAPALAQAYQCTPPARLGALPVPRPDGPARRAPIGQYTLAVTWAPEFCRNDRDPNSIECSGRSGGFGFVLHGLWPESRSGPPPQWCSITPRPSPQLIRQNLCMTPVPTMLEHEWARHGSCMAKTPAAYYAAAAHLWSGLHWPDADRLSRQRNLTVGDLRAAIALANPAWRPEQIGVVTSPGGWLRELRLCYSRRLKPVACARGQLGPPDAAPLKIWRGL